MCGRYSITTPLEAMRRLFDVDSGLNLRPRYNVAPTDEVPVLRLRDGGRELTMMRWGLVPAWAKDVRIGARMINARAETLATQAGFKEAFARRRCLIPADGFYEWERRGRQRLPYWIHLPDAAPFAFAGLWERWKQPDGQWLLSCTIVTTDANETVRPIHDRMPVILPPDAYERWLAEPDQALLRPWAGPPPLVATAVSQRVNNVRNDDPACLAPPGADQPPLL